MTVMILNAAAFIKDGEAAAHISVRPHFASFQVKGLRCFFFIFELFVFDI